MPVTTGDTIHTLLDEGEIKSAASLIVEELDEFENTYFISGLTPYSAVELYCVIRESDPGKAKFFMQAYRWHASPGDARELAYLAQQIGDNELAFEVK